MKSAYIELATGGWFYESIDVERPSPEWVCHSVGRGS